MDDSVERWITVGTGVCVMLTAGYAALRGFKKWLRAQVVAPVQRVENVSKRVESQVHANAGFSLADQVTKVDDTVNHIDTKVDRLSVRFDDHLRLGHPPAPTVTVIRTEEKAPEGGH
jgi:hypothetical protein